MQNMNEKYEQAIAYYLEYKSLNKTAKEFSISANRFSIYLKSKGMNIVNYQNAARMSEESFSRVDSEESAYWLGFMYADGWVYENEVGLGLAEKDYGHLVKYKNFLKYTGEIRYKEKTKSYTVAFRNKKIANNLILLGCVNNKSLILKFPTEDIVPKKYLAHFCRGYIDGDGSISEYKLKNSIGPRLSLLGTREFIDGFVNAVGIKRLKLHKNNKDNDSNNWFMQWNADYVYDTLDFLYKDSSIYLDRKYNKYLKLKHCRYKVKAL